MIRIIAFGRWPGGATWLARPSTLWESLQFAFPSRQITASAVVVLQKVKGYNLPFVFMTMQTTGRNGEPPKWEMSCGHVDPRNPAKPKGMPETSRRTGRRETFEELGVKLGWISLYMLRVITNPPGSNPKYPPVSRMTYYVGYARKVEQPTDGEHTRGKFSLQRLGQLWRDGLLELDELKFVREAIIAMGYKLSDINDALGSDVAEALEKVSNES